MTKCPECGFEPLEPKKRVENNEVVEGGQYCPDCETEYNEDTVFSWDDLDFPVWIKYNSYDDDWGLWRRFCRQENLYVPNFNEIRDMKYTVLHVWFKVDEDGSVHGPFENRGDEKELNIT